MIGVESSANDGEWIGNLTWFWLALLVAQFAVLAWWKKIYPHVPLLVIAAIPCLLTIGLFLRPDLARVVLVADALIGAVVQWMRTRLSDEADDSSDADHLSLALHIAGLTGSDFNHVVNNAVGKPSGAHFA